MIWRRHTNYHGSREYDDELPSDAVAGQREPTIARILDVVRRSFEALVKPIDGRAVLNETASRSSDR
jgi:hypothetical protein